MVHLPFGEAHTRRRFAEASLDSYRTLLEQHPDMLPELYPGYRDEMRAILDRFFVPNIKISRYEVELTTPKQYRVTNAIGLVAMRPLELMVLDRWLTVPSQRQREQHHRFLATHTTDKDIRSVAQELEASFAPTSGVRKTMPYGVDACAMYDRVAYGEPFFSRRTGMQFGWAAFKTMGPLALSLDAPISAATMAHEVDHIVEADGTGVVTDDHIDARKANMVSEQRAYYVGLCAANYLIDRGIDTSPALQEERDLSEHVDSIRRKHLGEGPQFGYSRALMEAYAEQNVLHCVLSEQYRP